MLLSSGRRCPRQVISWDAHAGDFCNRCLSGNMGKYENTAILLQYFLTYAVLACVAAFGDM